MALILLDDDLYHFQSMEEARIWIGEKNPKDFIILPEPSDALEFFNYLAEDVPIAIIE